MNEIINNAIPVVFNIKIILIVGILILGYKCWKLFIKKEKVKE